MKDILIMLWDLFKIQLTRQEKISSWIGTYLGGGVAITTKPMLTIGQVTLSGELYYIGRAILLMIIGAVVSYFVPKILKKWQNNYIDWRAKRKKVK